MKKLHAVINFNVPRLRSTPPRQRPSSWTWGTQDTSCTCILRRLHRINHSGPAQLRNFSSLDLIKKAWTTGNVVKPDEDYKKQLIDTYWFEKDIRSRLLITKIVHVLAEMATLDFRRTPCCRRTRRHGKKPVDHGCSHFQDYNPFRSSKVTNINKPGK